jgi:tripartite-type tricarboxylate transporter receptor subunit TctC
MIHVPYRGESAAMTDLLGGQPQVAFLTTGSSISFVRAGSVRALAVTSTAPLPGLPDVPPMAEFLPGYSAYGWSGLCAPKGVPADVMALLNRSLNSALADPAIKGRIAEMGGIAPGGSPADFASFIAEDIEKWKKVAAFAGVTAN